MRRTCHQLLLKIVVRGPDSPATVTQEFCDNVRAHYLRAKLWITSYFCDKLMGPPSFNWRTNIWRYAMGHARPEFPVSTTNYPEEKRQLEEYKSKCACSLNLLSGLRLDSTHQMRTKKGMFLPVHWSLVAHSEWTRRWDLLMRLAMSLLTPPSPVPQLFMNSILKYVFPETKNVVCSQSGVTQE